MELIFLKTFHLMGFAMCIGASFSKNKILQNSVVLEKNLKWLAILDKISGLSAVILLGTGIAMSGWFAKPFEYYSTDVLFWIKILLFVAASAAVIRTKPVVRLAQARGRLEVQPWLRFFLVFDFLCVAIIALIGIKLA